MNIQMSTNRRCLRMKHYWASYNHRGLSFVSAGLTWSSLAIRALWLHSSSLSSPSASTSTGSWSTRQRWVRFQYFHVKLQKKLSPGFPIGRRYIKCVVWRLTKPPYISLLYEVGVISETLFLINKHKICA